MEITISSKLSPDEVLKKIKMRVDPRGLFFGSMFGSLPFVGSFKGNHFKIRKRIFYNNSFSPIFYGEVVSSPNGSEIKGRFHIYLPVRIFMGIWFGVIGFGSISMWLNNSGHVKNINDVWPPFAMVALGYAFMKFGQWLGRGHYAAIQEYLRACV